jgi:hypothetical protein
VLAKTFAERSALRGRLESPVIITITLNYVVQLASWVDSRNSLGMEIDNQVQHASLSSSAFSVFSHTHKVCVQTGCMEVIPPGRTKSMCDRCWTRQGSFAKRQKTRHDASVTINPATSAVSSMDSTVKGWNSIVCSP